MFKGFFGRGFRVSTLTPAQGGLGLGLKVFRAWGLGFTVKVWGLRGSISSQLWAGGAR